MCDKLQYLQHSSELQLGLDQLAIKKCNPLSSKYITRVYHVFYKPLTSIILIIDTFIHVFGIGQSV